MNSNTNSKKGKRGFKKLITGMIAAAIAVVLCVTMIPQDALAATADVSTAGRYSESLGDDYSTEYAGRIWSDKSVNAGSVTYNGRQVTLGEGEDFLVTFSTLSTSQSITGSASAPVDVVFVLDTSSSMDTSMGNNQGNRLYNAVNALNASVKEVLSLNPNNRVGVVAFNSTSYTLLSLDSYSQDGRNEFFRCDRDGDTITIRAKRSSGQTVSTTHKASTGTNIQKGIAAGMNMLATERSTTANVNGQTITRIPSVIILSDGQPSNASSYSQWWNINDDTAKMTPASSNQPVFGMKAMMTAAYMKQAIDVNYNLVGKASKTTVYTIGVGITGLNTNDRNLAYVTLNPRDYLNANNDRANAIRNAWNSYRASNTSTASLNSFTFRHPSGNLINGVLDVGRISASDTIEFNDIIYNDAYYPADSASAVTDVFKQIVSNITISTPEVPTEIKGSNPITDGYITYTDPIGEYMEVKNIKALVYDDTTFLWDSTRDTKTTSGKVTTYTFKPTATVDTGVYEDQSVSNIIIEVTQVDTTNQTMVIKVPAALVPVRVNTVTLNANGNVVTHTHNGMNPVRVIYSVGIQQIDPDGTGSAPAEDIVKNGVVDTSLLSDAYVSANKNADGTINFYSNKYTGQEIEHMHIDGSTNTTTVGDTTVTFEPSHSNPFYYIPVDTKVYRVDNTPNNTSDDVAATTADLDANGKLKDGTYHYIETYYHGNEVVTKIVERTAAQLNRTDLEVKDGVVYREAGTPRLNKIMLFEGTKADEGASTGTAKDFYLPTFEYGGANKDDALAGYYTIYLGNNGVLSLAASGELEISKTVEIESGVGPGDIGFEFTVGFDGDVRGSFLYDIYDADGNKVSTGTNYIADRGKITLKNGQKAIIEGLPDGMGYTVTETAVVGFTTTSDVTTAAEDPTEGGNEVTGNITAGVKDTAAFTNTYNATPVTYPTESGIRGTKVLDGRNWFEDETYDFALHSYNGAPLPAGAEDANPYILTVGYEDILSEEHVDNDTDTAIFDFGTITFTEPGTYEYTVYEKEPTVSKPGMTYSRALYMIVVEVEDNGQGALVIESDNVQKLYTDTAEKLFAYDNQNNIVMNAGQAAQDAIAFKNTYQAGPITRTPVATKSYTDTTGTKPFTSGMFEFKFEPIGTYNGEELVTTPEAIAKVPMPKDEDGNKLAVAVKKNESYNVTFPSVTFTQSDIPENEIMASYMYKISEVIPTDATSANDYTVNGMKYDATQYFVKVTISNDGGEYLTFESEYFTGSLDNLEEVTDDNVARFTNAYDPADVTAALGGTKVLTGREWKDSDSFEFKLLPANAAAGTLISNELTDVVMGSDEDREFIFNELTFSRPGTYVFNIRETQGSIAGITYDNHVSVVTVVVSDNNQGALVVNSITYSDAVEGANGATFTNTYSTEPATVDVNLKGIKQLTGRPINAGEFFFVVNPLNGAPTGRYVDIPVPAVTTGTDNVYVTGEVDLLGEVVFDKAGTYTYEIYEQIPTGAVDNKYAGVTYDTDRYTLTVEVADNGLGKLEAVVTLEDASGNTIDAETDGDYVVRFENKYNVSSVVQAAPQVDKDLEGYRNTPLQAGEFLFEMFVDSASSADGVTLPTPVTATNDENGSVAFGSLTFTKAGEYVIGVREVAPTTPDSNITYSNNVLKVKYTVVDNGRGGLIVSTSHAAGEHTFVNTYNTSGILNINVHKTLDGREWAEGDTFVFEVVVADQATQEAVAAGHISFEDASGTVPTLTIAENDSATDYVVASPDITITKPGTYSFNVHEMVGNLPAMIYDGSIHTVIVTAEDDGEGHINATYTVEGATYVPEGSASTTSNILEFRNVYDPDSTSLSGHNNLRVIKNFTGREDNVWYESDKFTFELSAYDEMTQNALVKADDAQTAAVELPENTTLEITNSNRLHAHFGDIIFHEAGSYQFLIKEVAGTAGGVTYDNAKYVVTVNVAAASPSATELTATVTSVTKDDVEVVDKNITFDNTYDVKEVKLLGETYLKVTKVLEGRDWFDSDAFKFTLEAYGDRTINAVNATEPTVILPDNATGITATKANGGIANFGDITFKEAGTYHFVVREVNDGVDGITYDSHDAFIAVTVTDDKEGNLVAAVPTDLTTFTFTNTYAPDPISVTLKGTKTVDGRSLLPTDEFEFVITAVTEGAPMPAVTTVRNTDGGVVSFGAVQYTEEGTYVYTVSEKNGNIAGIEYDANPVTVTVTVTNIEAKGELEASVSCVKAGEAIGSEFSFTNIYRTTPTDPVTISASKVVTPTPGNTFHMDEGDFAFEIKPAESNPDSDPIEQGIVRNSGDGTIFFDKVEYTEPETYLYTIHEIGGVRPSIKYDETVYTVTVVVSDDVSAAKLHAEVTFNNGTADVNNVVFDNGYDPTAATAIIHGHKYLDSEHKDLEANEFQFQLRPVTEGAPMPEGTMDGVATVKNEETGLFQFGLITYNTEGTYEYKVTEVNAGKAGYGYSAKEYTVTVVVTNDQEAGALLATVSGVTDANDKPIIVFNNTYVPGSEFLSDIGGTKVLEGRPLTADEFEFELIDNVTGEVIATAKNTEEGRFAFNNIEFTTAGIHTFTIVEKDTNSVGVTYATNIYGVVVEIEDMGGYLEEVSTTYYANDLPVDAEDVIFTNVYEAVNPATIQLGAAKTLSGRELKAGEFTFLLTGSDGTALTAVNGADGSVLFDAIQFTEAGTYTYVITEAKGNAEYVTYDGSKFTVTVVVTDDLKGNLVAEITSITESVAGREVGASAVVFENTYTAPDPGTSPKTNDIFNLWMLLAVICAAGFGLFGATVYSRRS